MTLPLPAIPDDPKQQQVNDFMARQFPLGSQHLQAGVFPIAAIAAADAPNSSLFIDSSNGKLSFKEADGDVVALY